MALDNEDADVPGAAYMTELV